MEKVVVLAGGFSEEREVSLVSSREIEKMLQAEGFETCRIDPSDFPNCCEMVQAIRAFGADVVFIGLHGGDGEDGRVQGLLSLAGIPYTGSNWKASAIAMDKNISMQLAQAIDIEVPEYICIGSEDDFNGWDVEIFGYPFVIKPNQSGSSVGVTIVENESQIDEAMKTAFQYGSEIIVQRFIRGDEITATILGDEALPLVRILPHKGFYDYTNKYTKGNTNYEVPAKIPEEARARIQADALRIYQLMGCSGYARVDFRFDGETSYFLEVNTLPGMTPLSLTPMAAKEAGYSFGDLLKKIIDIALIRL